MLKSVIEAPGAIYDDPHKVPVMRPGSVQLETKEQ
jgi:hypothetical protein